MKNAVSLKILIVCSGNSGRIAPFITDQAQALTDAGLTIEFFVIRGKGIKGYLSNLKPLRAKIKTMHPDVIHAHFGLSALFANMQRKVPVVSTYHGSDINNDRIFIFSKLAMALSAFNIFVSVKNQKKAGQKARLALLPCGVDTGLFVPRDKAASRNDLNLNATEKYVLFSGAFDNPVKNAGLAQKAVDLLPGVTLIELKGYDRSQVATLMNAVDLVLMTSFTEGSPQFIKEAMSCNCPIVSVDVGDVSEITGNIAGCFIAGYDEEALAAGIKQALGDDKRTNARKHLLELGLDNKIIAEKLKNIYNSVLYKY